MGTIKTTNIESISGSGTVTLGTSGETFALGTGVSSQLSRPAFFVNKSASQSLSDSAWTQVTLDSEVFDTNSAFASNTFTVPTSQAGKYFISFQCFGYDSAGNLTSHRTSIYKNDASVARSQIELDGQDFSENTLVLSCILDLSAADTIKFYAFLNTSDGGTADVNGDSEYRTFVQGYKLGA